MLRTPIPTTRELNLYHPTADELAALRASDADYVRAVELDPSLADPPDQPADDGAD